MKVEMERACGATKRADAARDPSNHEHVHEEGMNTNHHEQL
ncbi:MAG: hypothetical protein ACLTT1_08370 [[Clostridium] scindens]